MSATLMSARSVKPAFVTFTSYSASSPDAIFFGPAILVSSASVSNILSTVMLSRCTSIPPAVVPTKAMRTYLLLLNALRSTMWRCHPVAPLSRIHFAPSTACHSPPSAITFTSMLSGVVTLLSWLWYIQKLTAGWLSDAMMIFGEENDVWMPGFSPMLWNVASPLSPFWSAVDGFVPLS